MSCTQAPLDPSAAPTQPAPHTISDLPLFSEIKAMVMKFYRDGAEVVAQDHIYHLCQNDVRDSEQKDTFHSCLAVLEDEGWLQRMTRDNRPHFKVLSSNFSFPRGRPPGPPPGTLTWPRDTWAAQAEGELSDKDHSPEHAETHVMATETRAIPHSDEGSSEDSDFVVARPAPDVVAVVRGEHGKQDVDEFHPASVPEGRSTSHM